jgi:hypothetical protein
MSRLVIRVNNNVGGAVTEARVDLARLLVKTLPFVEDGTGPFPSTSSRTPLGQMYGQYTPDTNPNDYTQNTVGARNRWVDLTEFNSPTTNEVVLTKNTVIQNQIIYGRVKNTQYTLETENCIFAGPYDPTIATGETAILDNNSVYGSKQNHHIDCTIFMRNPHPRWNGFKGMGYKAERCHTLYVTDGHGPYTNYGSTAATNVQIWGNKIEALINFPGTLYASKGPLFWDGSTWTSSGTFARTTADKTPYFDDQHKDGTHNDGIEVHGGFGSHTMIDPDRDKWDGDGIDIWGNSWINNDPYGETIDPTGLGLPVPAYLGDGANINRGIKQFPGMTRPVTSGWNNPLLNGRYAALGSGVIILQLVNQFPDPTTVLFHGNYMDMGGIGMQEQKKTYGSIQFTAYDNYYGPNFYMWRSLTQGDTSNRDIYPIRINDGTDATVVKISGDPRTGASWQSSQIWRDPQNKWGRNGQSMVTGSSSVPGIRYG